MDVSETVTTGATTEELYDLVADLGTYPDWLGLVVRAIPEHKTESGVWTVEIQGRVGPFARSKRLRMVRTVDVRPEQVVFERIEVDGRDHAQWRLEAAIAPSESGAVLTMNLHYAGNRFAPILAPMLREEIRRGRRKLQHRYPPHT